MKQTLLIIYFFCLTLLAFAQEKVISGILTDEYGSPLPGVSVFIKGTSKGTLTDANGYYQISAPIGATLVYQAVGMRSKEVLIGGSVANTPQNNPKKSSSLGDSTVFDYSQYFQKIDSLVQRPKRVAVLTDSLPTYQFGNRNYNPPRIPIIYQLKTRINPKTGKIERYIIDTNPPYSINNRSERWKVNVQTTFSWQSINRLPALQSTFAQGSPQNGQTVWRGAEANEIFSWGPALSSLEFTGSSYPFDQNGSLTTSGNGNGTSAKAYNPFQFLRHAYQWYNNVQIHKDFGGTDLLATIHYNRQNYGISQSNSEQFNATLKHQIRIGRTQLLTNVAVQDARQTLPIMGANWQTILGSVYRTPITFDNANGLNRRNAWKNPTTYVFNDGSSRSHSPSEVDNPYGLVNNIPDKQNNHGFNFQTKATARYGKLDFDYRAGFENQVNNRQFGLLPQSAGALTGRFTHRNHRVNNFFFRANNEWNFWRLASKRSDYKTFNLIMQYQFQHENQNLNRVDAFDFPLGVGFDLSKANTLNHLDFNQSRNTHQIFTKVAFQGFRRNLRVNLGNQTYFSSTLKGKDNKFLLPQMIASFNLRDLVNSFIGIDQLEVSTAYSSSVQEAPLVYNQWHFNSLNLTSANYAQYYESTEVFWQESLHPERHRKFDVGLNMGWHFGLNWSINYFANRTLDMLSPIFVSNQFHLQNLADVKNQGWDAQVNFQTRNFFYRYEDFFGWRTTFNFSRYNPMVTRVNSATRVPLAGYSDISSNLLENQPLGVLVGSTFLRNSEGKVVMDDSGYPLVNPIPQVLGNPNPDYTMAWENEFRIENFSLSFNLEYRHGGVMWNGTSSALNYLGVSQLTANQRNTTNYVFSGVRLDNSPNQQTVDFANPANGLAGNRWARYGWSGVAEEAIEDASWLRFNEIKLRYDFTKILPAITRVREAYLYVYVKNILLYAPYSGIDPKSTLLNYRQGMGLDMFNTPNMTSYGLQLELKL